MKKLLSALEPHAKRIDALTLRERAIMFVSIAVAIVAAFDHWVLSPRMAEQKAFAAQMRKASSELAGLRGQVAPSQVEGPGAKLVRELEQLRGEQQQLDLALAQLHGGAATGTQLPDLLERVLRRHEKLTLLRLATVKAGPEATASPHRQSVHIAMRGSYPDLTKYLADTESALPGLRWGEVAITRQGQGAELSATVILQQRPS